MQAVLAIVGCGVRLEVALADGRAPAPGVVALPGPTPRSELVVAAVDLLLRGAGLESRHIALILAARGPGSFTGIRVALATAQGLARAIGCPARGFPSLSVLAARAPGRRRLAVQGARRGYVYVQTFEDRGEAPHPLDEVRVVALDALPGLPDPVVGPEGFPFPPGVRLAPTTRGAAEALLALGALPIGEAEPLTPLYVEAPQATPPARRAS